MTRTIFAVLLVVMIQVLTIKQVAYPQENAQCTEKGNVFEQLRCLADQAVARRDVSVCDRSKHVGVKYQCYAIYAEKAEDWEICNRIPPKNKDFIDLRAICISDVAKKMKKEELCGKVTVQGFRDACYLKIAGSTGNKVLCKKILDPGTKSLCTGKPIYVK